MHSSSRVARVDTPCEARHRREILRGIVDGREPISVTVVAAHPDDEIAGCGGLLRRLSDRGATIEFVHVTDGAPRNMKDARAAGIGSREAYARARRLELASALRAGDIRVARAFVLGAVDQEASFELARLSRTIEDILGRTLPDVVVTHPYEGGHPDHDATAFAVHTAAARLGRPGASILEFTSYHLGPEGIRAGLFLERPEVPERIVDLKAGERRAKVAMLERFTSQRRVLDQFPVAPERVRSAPCYDFSAPPHSGKLFYELFDWGMTGEVWRARAAEALQSLA